MNRVGMDDAARDGPAQVERGRRQGEKETIGIAAMVAMRPADGAMTGKLAAIQGDRFHRGEVRSEEGFPLVERKLIDASDH